MAPTGTTTTTATTVNPMDATDLPPFPDDVPMHPLLVIDYALIKERNAEETERLWTAATKLGFW